MAGPGGLETATILDGVTLRLMEPVTTVTTAWTIARTAGEISKKLYDVGKSLKDREAKAAR